MVDGRTHFEGCWREHRDCCVAEVERLRALLAEARHYVADAEFQRLAPAGSLARIDAALQTSIT